MDLKHRKRASKRQFLLYAFGWSAILSVSLAWNLHTTRTHVITMAINTARATFDKDLAFRRWATRHGGVYVPATKQTPPNPYLSHVPDRDIVKPDGTQLTLMNPAYMLRQMMEQFPGLYGAQGRIVSLKPLNPNNAPDSWETRALQAFEQGSQEAMELSNFDGAPHLRLIRPMIAKPGCLKCHAFQGYKVGDVRGGIGVAVPMAPFFAEERSIDHTLIASHGAFLALGFASLVFGYRRRLRGLSVEEAMRQRDRKRMTALRSAHQEAEAANRAKDQFLAAMSHEIRTPIHVITGMGELLAESHDGMNRKRYLETLNHACDGLLSLIDDVLDMSRIESGQIELSAHPFQLECLVRSVGGIFEMPAQERGIALIIDIDPLAPQWVHGDDSRLRQLLINLTGNALKFTAAGEIRIGVERADEGVLRFCVCDTGIGIAADKLDAIFQPFTQADSAITRRFGGAGLGLSICRNIIERMNGRIWVESVVGAGSKFFFEAPFPVVDASRLEAPGQTAHPNQELHAQNGLNILVAEDTDDNITLMNAYLSNTPHRATFARDGLEAVNALRAGAFDIVLMDVQMPNMDGYSATREIRCWEQEMGRTPTPIYALSAHALSDSEQHSLDAGCNGHLTKPIKKRDLLAFLEQLPGRRAAES
ncbi:ATP-binding protein [Magnetofaba australis]|uniref:histidine kinase n=1 Tax=Magnetofaba australis IT-1 TaxID=1434232 RepID=A0A1Y2K1X2_9PROT|nr:ATP-binding protein [Magnetofaba australis]OSM02008.1 putative histidine kinase [Magnetofaba australis IT-1]